MSDGIYLLALLAPAVLGAVLGAIPFLKREIRSVSIILCAVSCLVGIMAYPYVVFYNEISYTFPIGSVLGRYGIAMDDLSALMISFSSIVFLMIVLHMLRSPSAPAKVKYYSTMNLLFFSCIVAMCANEVIMILVAWEMVTLATFIMSYNKNEGGRWKFFIIAHLGGLMVISAFIFMYVFAGTNVLSEWNGLNAVMGLKTSCVVIMLLFMGFGTKLGLIPFHAWMPDLYAEAPTHTTALLSTVSSNVAVLLLFKSVFSFVGVTGEMYGLAIILMVLSSVTAIWGALESLIQTEPKRILAYSSMENMALVSLCFSVGMLFCISGSTELMTLAVIAGILHTINHSVFKALMMLTVSTVEDTTGETAIGRMGGLAVTLPAFSVLALIAVLSMAAIPPFSGFMSEWMMIQSMLSGNGAGVKGLELILPLGVAVLGISGMMAAVSYARLYGFMFLGRPRSERVANPNKVRRLSFIPMLVLGGMCLALGVFAYPVMDGIAGGIAGSTGDPASELYKDMLLSTLDLPVLSAVFLALVIAMYGISRVFRNKAAKTETWDCGTPLESHMQYSSVGFSQPLVRVFHPIYGDITEMEDDGSEEHKKTYTVKFTEPFVRYLYEPIGKLVLYVSKFMGKMQNGNIQTYLGYILAVLVVLLLGVRLL